MKHKKYEWEITCSKIHAAENRISFLEETIYDLEDFINELADSILEVTNDIMHLGDSRSSDPKEFTKEYFKLIKKRAGFKEELREAEQEQEYLEIFYSNQYKLSEYSAEKESNKEGRRERFPGKKLSSHEKLLLIELLSKNGAFSAISSTVILKETLPYITGIFYDSLEGNLKSYPRWFLPNVCNENQSTDRKASLDRIKGIIVRAGNSDIASKIISKIDEMKNKFEQDNSEGKI